MEDLQSRIFLGLRLAGINFSLINKEGYVINEKGRGRGGRGGGED